MTSLSSPVTAPPLTGEVEPCPTPLAWSDVLQRVRAERESFECSVNGRPVRVSAIGTGRPLYFLNPAAGDCDQFALLGWLLRERLRCVFFDEMTPPGFGDDPVEAVVQSVLAAADRLGDERFAVLAPGWASLPAIRLLDETADRIHAAILICGYAYRRLSWLERGLLAWGSVLPGRLGQLPGWGRIQRQNHRPWFPPFDPTRWEFLYANLAASPIRDVARRLAVLQRIDLRPVLERIQQPVLLVRTEGEGSVATQCQQELETGLPRGCVEWMHTSGHFPHLTHPHRVAKLVTQFLSEVRVPAEMADATKGAARRVAESA